MIGRLLRFSPRSLSVGRGKALAKAFLETAIGERSTREADSPIEEPEVLLEVCSYLRDQFDSSPSKVRSEAEYFYRFVETPKRAVGLFDERDYFLGEFALIAGTACRQLSRRQEARAWFDRAESGFRNTVNPAAELSRLAYQRLALRLEERELDVVLELAPPLAEGFLTLGMPEEALKCRFLEGIALVESGRVEAAIDVFVQICKTAEETKSERLLGLAYTNLTHYYGMLGDSENAITWSQRAIPLLKRLDDRVGLAKVQWGLATLLRENGQGVAAIEAYRCAQEEFRTIGMRADVAALHLVVADLLLESGQEVRATKEILFALPILDELQMVPEGTAALSLLRESVRQQRVNRQALRDLHGYFEDIKS
jgi:tetratricopeptide (TPR) repeat protein